MPQILISVSLNLIEFYCLVIKIRTMGESSVSPQNQQQQLTIFYNGQVRICDVTEFQVIFFFMFLFFFWFKSENSLRYQKFISLIFVGSASLINVNKINCRLKRSYCLQVEKWNRHHRRILNLNYTALIRVFQWRDHCNVSSKKESTGA